VERWSGHDAWWGSSCKLNPKNFGPNLNSIKYWAGEGNLGSVGFPETTKIFRPDWLVGWLLKTRSLLIFASPLVPIDDTYISYYFMHIVTTSVDLYIFGLLLLLLLLLSSTIRSFVPVPLLLYSLLWRLFLFILCVCVMCVLWPSVYLRGGQFFFVCVKFLRTLKLLPDCLLYSVMHIYGVFVVISVVWKAQLEWERRERELVCSVSAYYLYTAEDSRAGVGVVGKVACELHLISQPAEGRRLSYPSDSAL